MGHWQFYDTTKQETILFSLEECEACGTLCEGTNTTNASVPTEELRQIGLQEFPIPKSTLYWSEELTSQVCSWCLNSVG